MKPVITTLLLLILGTIAANSATMTWTNTSGGNWSVAANWSPNQVPGSSDNAIITASGTYTVTFNASATIAGLTLGGTSGTQIFSLGGNTLTLNGLATINSNGQFNLSGGTLAGTNGVITGVLTWTSGTIPIGSTLTIATNGMLIWAGTADSYSFYGALTNAGTVLLTNGDWKWWSCYANPVQFINLPGALLDIKADVSIVDPCGGGSLVNYGTVRKSGGAGTSTINAILNMNSTGTLDVQTGTVSIAGGGSGNGVFQADAGATSQFNGNYTVNSGAQFIGAGTNLLVGGTFTLNGTISSSNAVLAGATLAGTNGVITGVLTWTSGTIPIGSTLTIATNGMLIWAGTADSYSFYGALTNAGTVLLTNGDWKWWSCYANPVQFINLPGALLDIKADVSIVDPCGGGSLVNYGTVRKSGGTGTTTISPIFNNFGTLDAQGGIISLSGSYNLTNGTLDFGISSPASYGKINLSGSPAVLTGTLSANLNNGYVPASGNSFSVLTYSSRTGTFTNLNLPFAVAWQTNYGSTAFTLTVLNVRPTLAAIPDQTVNELMTLTVTNSASDPDIGQTLTFALVSAPSGMTINPTTGLISWTPQQTNSPSTNTVLVSVTDNGTPPLSVTNSFKVIVWEVNVASSLPTIPTQTVNELTLLTVTNTATDSNIHSTITGYGLINPPQGLSINANGIITWTPSQMESPSTNTIGTVVTNSNPYDTVSPSLTSTNYFTVIVREVNVPPSLPTISTQFVNPLTLLTVTNTATNANIHATITGYTLVNPPSNMVISASGIITWTPSQAQSPSTNVITTIVTNMDSFDFVNPQLTSTNSFAVVVKAVNVAAHYIRRAGQTLTTDIPGASVSGGPSYWQIFLPFSMQTSGNQIFFGRPDSQTEANGVGAASSSTLQWFTTIPVSTLPGLNSPPASIVSASSDVIWTNGVIDEATSQFVSIELVDFTPYIQGVTQKNGSFTFSWNALAGQSYQVEYKTNIVQTNWADFGSPITATNGTMTASDLMTNLQRFYRVTLLP